MKIIIAGAYAIGTYLAKLLSRNNQDIVLMDENLENLEKINIIGKVEYIIEKKEIK